MDDRIELRVPAEHSTDESEVSGALPGDTGLPDEDVPEGLTIFEYPEHQRRKLRTTNPLENLSREVRRRTRVATIFPIDPSLLRLVSAVLVEMSDGWETDRVYLAMGKDR